VVLKDKLWAEASLDTDGKFTTHMDELWAEGYQL
jgi:hypothetical protein